MTIKEYYDYNPVISLYESCKDIDQFGGYEIFDDVTRMFYSKQGIASYDVNNISDVSSFRTSFIIAWATNYYFIKTLYNTMMFEYDPIENYRRNEKEYTINNERNSKSTAGGYTDNTTSNNGTSYQHNSTTYNDTNARLVDSDNTNTTSNTTATVGDRNVTSGYDKSQTNTVKNVVSGSENVDGDNLTARETLIFGNAGTTSTQSMIQEERKVADMNFYKIVIERLISCICDGVL